MDELNKEILPWFGLLVPIIAALVTGFFAYRIGSRKDANTTQAALHGGFKILIDELQAERDRLAAQLAKLIDDGNEDLKREMMERFADIEDRIEHNRRNADHNFGIINEMILDVASPSPPSSAPKRPPPTRARLKILPQRLPKDAKDAKDD